MDSLSPAVSLCRALLTLSRAGVTGVLSMRAERGDCRVAMVSGVPRAASGCLGDPGPLGDSLLGEGSLDSGAHARALQVGRPVDHEPVGRWLVDAGLSSRGAVEAGLRRQLRGRMLSVCKASGLAYEFTDGAADVGVRWLDEPEPTVDLVLGVLRELLREQPRARLTRAIESDALRISVTGHALLGSATLWPEEHALWRLLARGTTLREVTRVTGGTERALRFVALLSLLGAIDAIPARGSYGLLLRKRRQVRAKANSYELLGASIDASPADARRALHRLARELHPDRFTPHAAAALVDASQEVMGALVSAERSVRGGR